MLPSHTAMLTLRANDVLLFPLFLLAMSILQILSLVQICAECHVVVSKLYAIFVFQYTQTLILAIQHPCIFVNCNILRIVFCMTSPVFTGTRLTVLQINKLQVEQLAHLKVVVFFSRRGWASEKDAAVSGDGGGNSKPHGSRVHNPLGWQWQAWAVGTGQHCPAPPLSCWAQCCRSPKQITLVQVQVLTFHFFAICASSCACAYTDITPSLLLSTLQQMCT